LKKKTSKNREQKHGEKESVEFFKLAKKGKLGNWEGGGPVAVWVGGTTVFPGAVFL